MCWNTLSGRVSRNARRQSTFFVSLFSLLLSKCIVFDRKSNGYRITILSLFLFFVISILLGVWVYIVYHGGGFTQKTYFIWYGFGDSFFKNMYSYREIMYFWLDKYNYLMAVLVFFVSFHNSIHIILFPLQNQGDLVVWMVHLQKKIHK